MRELWNKMMVAEPSLPPDETIISRKVATKLHNFYLYYNRQTKEAHFAIELTKTKKPSVSLPNCKGFTLVWGTLPFTADTKPSLIITCNGVVNNDFFLRVVDDLKNTLQRVKEEDKMIVKALGRITLWQDFFKKHGEKGFPPQKQKGLYGELCSILHTSKDIPLAEVVTSWMGAYKNSHDFHFEPFHLETKVTTRKDPVFVRIHGVEQLTVPNDKELYLHVLSVAHSEVSGETVIDIEKRITARLLTEPEALEKFHSKLLSCGYPIGGFSNPMHFEVESEAFYHVKEGFPKIEKQKGIENVEYDILINEITDFNIDSKELSKKLASKKKAV